MLAQYVVDISTHLCLQVELQGHKIGVVDLIDIAKQFPKVGLPIDTPTSCVCKL